MRQLTQGINNHILTNADVWSPDGQWIYFDSRSDGDGSIFDSQTLGRVHVPSGRVETVFEARQGACVGVVTACPTDDRVVFIHGPENPTAAWQYNAYHRRGVLTIPNRPEQTCNLDARDLSPPFTPGALRGGSHVHVFSGDGKWVSFTYEDHVLATDKHPAARLNQRGVGVSVPTRGVDVPKTHPRNHDGTHFSVLVTQTWDRPTPGSDEINRAYSDAWVGIRGYRKSNGERQDRAIAFLGDCLDEQGATITELFIVDVPDDVTVAGDSPLCGTETNRPSPPAGTRQRRLTHTVDRKHPGISGVRHWPRSSPDGERIAFLMRDERGVSQLWLISPRGDNMRQLTHSPTPIQSAFTYRSDGRTIACVIDTRVCEVDVDDGSIHALAPKVNSTDSPLRLACVYSPDGTQITYLRRIATPAGPRNHIFVGSTTLRPQQFVDS
ncbi:DUF3748 domain-containing protein [Aporhodopirellula aestuarii]|uniref:DUF3748 domain-containing protein n=1 Tax=Aporhodopirellula aestuarii TaxID=2950107 RepID=A0ABT0U313_9BACT|nr:DUF3748 domain-containing protein [Aporhodopirellula aestuarii]MCM2371285.1 DUF3748 domain-containing protein [Aporhodopirellula aestuarii]